MNALRREPIAAIGGVYTGPLDGAQSVPAPVRRFGPPAADVIQPIPYSAAQTMADFLWPAGSLNSQGGRFERKAS
jgi:hypothetical protein